MNASSPPRRRLGRLASPAFLVWASLAAFTFAFLGTTALGMGPDEPAHYIKAAAAARGQLDGTRATAQQVRNNFFYARAQSDKPAERERARLTAESGTYNSRFFSLPADVAPKTLFPCFAQLRSVSARCGTVLSRPARNPDHLFDYIGGYPPVPYAVAGVPSLLPMSASARWHGARVVNAAVALALLACAVVLAVEATRRRAWRIAAIAIAVPPTSVFLFAVVNASGWELAGGLTVAAAVLRLSRPAPPTARTWALVATGATALAISRPLGPFWLLPFALVLLTLVGPRGIGTLWKGGRAPKVAVAVVALASASTLLWVRVNDASAPLIGSRIGESFRLAVSDLVLVVLQLPAIFGWNDTPIWIGWYWMFGLGVVGLCAIALVFGRRRERLALALTVAFAVLGAIFIAAVPFEMYRQRYAMQARYILPFAVLVPFLIGELLGRAAGRAPRARESGSPWYPTGGVLPACVVAFMTLVQLVGWWTNAVRNARGWGHFAFWGDNAWVPVGGWAPWIVLVVVGVATGFSAAAMLVRDANRSDASLEGEPPQPRALAHDGSRSPDEDASRAAPVT